MKVQAIMHRAGAVFLLLASLATQVDASRHAHEQLQTLHKKHHAHHEIHRSVAERADNDVEHAAEPIEKRSGSCLFPTNVGLVAVTPDQQNAGWAQAPDMPCTPGKWCPYACPPGQLMSQWDPSVTSYIYPGSTHGGLYCDSNGQMQKGFSANEYCVEGEGTAIITNSAGGVSAWCQTVLPGYEDMLIPTSVSSGSEQVMAVPGPDYWAGTASHFYVNAPGVSVSDGCVWGTNAKPVGNWAPYVAGANVDSNGNTFLKLGINPIQLEAGCSFSDTIPTWGINITCDGDCNGLPCAIDPTRSNFNEISGASSIGAGGAAFCVATAPKGVKAYFNVFDTAGGSSVSSSSGSSKSSSSSSSSAPSSTPSSSSAAPSSTSTSSSSVTSTSSKSSTSSSSSVVTTSSSTSSSSSSSSSVSTVSNAGHMLYENATAVNTTMSSSSSGSLKASTTGGSQDGAATASAAAATTTSKSGASALQISVASLTMSFLIISLMMAFS